MDGEKAYNQALDYLYSFIDYSLKKSSELARATFDLGRMRDLMSSLGNPERTYPILHVAGTKGKGSTCALMAAALQAGGYATGLYTSPHLQDYTERIRVNGIPISHQELVDLVELIKPTVARVEKLTTFEITTAMGFLYFARKKVDAAVVEVGLGGRLDATNVVTPLVSVITSLSYDHMAVLGNTLEKIAGEKAGIIKEGVPVVSAPQKQEALSVLERIAHEKHAPFTLVGRDIHYIQGKYSLDGQALTIEGESFKIPLLGEHQVINATSAYAAIKASGLQIDYKDMATGFARVEWPCRFEILQREPAVVLDSAHNAESALRLRETLDQYFPNKPVICIFAVLEDKDVSGILESLKPRLTKLIVKQADHPRALEASKIVELAYGLEIPAEALPSSSNSLERAFEIVGNNGMILVAGSVAFAGEMKSLWEKSRQGKKGYDYVDKFSAK